MRAPTARIGPRGPLAAGLALALAVLLTACGDSHHGIADRSPNAIVAAATKAIDGVRTVRVSGAVAGGRTAVDLDLRLVAGRGATGSMSQAGLRFKLITIGGEAYIDGSPSFWRQYAGPAAAGRLQGRWLRAPADTGDFQSFSSLTDLHRLLSGLLDGHGALSKGEETTIRGQRAIVLHDADRKGTLYVAASGTPYPLRLENSGTGGGRIDFSDFDAPVALAPPRSSIDVSALKK